MNRPCEARGTLRDATPGLLDRLARGLLLKSLLDDHRRPVDPAGLRTAPGIRRRRTPTCPPRCGSTTPPFTGGRPSAAPSARARPTWTGCGSATTCRPWCGSWCATRKPRRGWREGWRGRPLRRLLHRLNDNTRSASRRNIAAHYDLGNDFYRLFLDPTLTYSCGIFERPDSTMEEASVAKFDRICRKLRLTPGMRLLEIGAGWGGFAIHAARHYGCHVTTTTISRQQFELADQRIREAGLTGRITLLAARITGT